MLLNLALTHSNGGNYKIAGQILSQTPIAQVINNLLFSHDQIDLNLLEVVIELAANLVKAKKYLTEDLAILLIQPLKIAVKSSQRSLIINGLEGLTKIADNCANLIPDIAKDEMLDQIINKMMEKDRLIHMPAHSCWVMMTVTNCNEIVDHFI